MWNEFLLMRFRQLNNILTVEREIIYIWLQIPPIGSRCSLVVCVYATDLHATATATWYATSTLLQTICTRVTAEFDTLTYINLFRQNILVANTHIEIDVVMADNINLFKNHLDKFWSSCEFVYSYRAQPFGTGSVK